MYRIVHHSLIDLLTLNLLLPVDFVRKKKGKTPTDRRKVGYEEFESISAGGEGDLFETTKENDNGDDDEVSHVLGIL